MNLSEKITKVLEAKKLTTHAAERAMNASIGTLAKTIKRDAGWHPATEEKFIRTFNVSSVWWETGTGPMFEKPDDSKLSEKEGVALRTAYKLIDRLEDDIRKLNEELAHYKKKSKT